jgi:hypothetical protein
VKYFIGLFAVVAVVAGGTAVAYHVWDDATHTKGSDNGGVLTAVPGSTIAADAPVPAAGQVLVSGSVGAAHLEGAVVSALATPLEITTPQRGEGSGATISAIQVNGQPSSIEWNAGRPFELSGNGGSLLLAPVSLDIAAGGARVTLDGQPHGFTPGTYTLDTPVAVATGGLGQPADKVTFSATPDSRVEFRGSASAPLPDGTVQVSGQGKVVFEGALTVERHDRSVATGPAVTLDSGTYQITFTPDGTGNYKVQATLSGNVH